jgi:hypothetical protein
MMREGTPKKFYPAHTTLSLLQRLYPDLDTSRLVFYEGLPWYSRKFAPYLTAQALPSFYSFGCFDIFLLSYNEEDPRCLADIVHECYHIMQAQQYLKGFGAGFLRGFTIYYAAWFFKSGYRQNPFEVPAYEQEYAFLRWCSAANIRSGFPADTGFNQMVRYKLARVASPEIWWMIPAFLLCVVLAVLKPFADILYFLYSRIKK